MEDVDEQGGWSDCQQEKGKLAERWWVLERISWHDATISDFTMIQDRTENIHGKSRVELGA